MTASWLVSHVIGLLRPAAAAVAGDIYRRFKIERIVQAGEPSRHSPTFIKAVRDLEIFLGNRGEVNEAIGGFLSELKDTGLLYLVALDAFYDLADAGVRLQFDAMLARYIGVLTPKEQVDTGKELFKTVSLVLRESIRLQTSNDILFVFDSLRSRHIDDDSGKIRAIVSEVRPDISKSVALATRSLIGSVSAPNGRVQLPGWVSLSPAAITERLEQIATSLVRAYEYVRIDGPAQRSVDCEIDKLYVPAVLQRNDFSIRRGLTASSQGDRVYQEYKALPYVTALADVRQCVILGDPGGGKSTLAQRLCLDGLRRLQQNTNSQLYLRVEVRRLSLASAADAFGGLLRFVAKELARQCNLHLEDNEWLDLVQHLLFFGRMVIVFDGVDEIVSAAKRRNIISDMKQFANRFLQNSFIFTCRRTDFIVTPIVSVEIFHLRHFSLEETKAYFRSASRWVFEKSEQEITREEGSFIEQAERHAEEFVRNPLLLALIVWIYSVGQRIPDNRIELYAKCSDLLFRRWDSLKAIDPEIPDPHWLFQLVTQLAHRLYLISPSHEQPNQDWLRSRVLEFFREVYEIDAENRAQAAADRFVSHLIGRSWILQERSAGIFEFSHRTFMEYFYARWLDDNFDSIDALLSHAGPYIQSGEQTVPLHLAFQMKTAGKLRSAQQLTNQSIELLSTIRADTRPKRAKDEAPINTTLANAVQFVIDSVGYLQPNEQSLIRIVRELTNAVESKEQWSASIGNLIEHSTKFKSAIVEGVYLALSDRIEKRESYKIGFVIDWLYACYLSSRDSHGIEFSPVVQRFHSVQRKFEAPFIARIEEAGVHQPSLPKIVFDLSQVTTEFASEAGLAMWSASVLPDRRLDWRYIDFSLGVIETAEVLLGRREKQDAPYFNLFMAISDRAIEQANFQMSGGATVVAPFDYSCIEEVAPLLPSCSIDQAKAFAVALVGIAELRMTQADDREAKESIVALLTILSERADLGAEVVQFLHSWIGGNTSLFVRSPSRRLVPADKVFLRRYDGESIA
jgi:NACHT domain